VRPVPNLAIDADMAYQIAYEAMIKGSLALMLSHGQRPRKQLGYHIAIIEFAQKNLTGGHTAGGNSGWNRDVSSRDTALRLSRRQKLEPTSGDGRRRGIG
jgi:hypothetical protein